MASLFTKSSMRRANLVAWAALCFPMLSAAAEPPASTMPRVYALVAAFGNQFEVVHEEPSVGSHLSPYRRRSVEVGGDMLNRVVLQGLDQALAKFEPSSRRISAPTRSRPCARSFAGSIEPGGTG